MGGTCTITWFSSAMVRLGGDDTSERDRASVGCYQSLSNQDILTAALLDVI